MLRVVKGKPDQEPPIACWDDSSDNGGTIWLLRRRSRIQKLEDLAHEFLHAANDWEAWVIAREKGD